MIYSVIPSHTRRNCDVRTALLGQNKVSAVQHLLSNSSQKGISRNKHRNEATTYDAPHHDALPASYSFQLKNFPNPVWFACLVTLKKIFLTNFAQSYLQIQQTSSIHNTATLTYAWTWVIVPSLYIFASLQMRGLNSLSPLLPAGCDFIDLCFTDSRRSPYCLISD